MYSDKFWLVSIFLYLDNHKASKGNCNYYENNNKNNITFSWHDEDLLSIDNFVHWMAVYLVSWNRLCNLLNKIVLSN